ncbi:MAG: 2-amino-4-hydroxy-6-hydroxymethyldihydropteridine diphosphokinase [Magnetococcales bacterium]|nr:2-amino-4-hydroxy-6-hydroxymethyldihydropteridine diphosphokinase [Magnetococcales bacterium]
MAAFDLARVTHPGRVAWIGIGGNLGNALAHCRLAVARLTGRQDVRLLAMSGFYLTEPVGPVRGQPWYVNAVAVVETRCGPRALLGILMRIERSLGRRREREVRWGPRRIDLDLLLHGDRIMNSPDLILPHPRLHRRRFVLLPMAALAPDLPHPRFAKTVDTLLRDVDDRGRVTPWPDTGIDLARNALAVTRFKWSGGRLG